MTILLADAASSRTRPSSALHSVTLILFLAAASVPTPLYRLYQQEWHFSPLILSVIFAVYALALLAALLVFGSLSDQVGRRPIILVALALELVAIILFLAAQNIGWLLTARLIQGVATALATTLLGASLLDIDRESGALTNSLATTAGTGFGAVGSSLLAQYAPAPLHLGYLLLLAIVFVQIIRTARAPETAPTRSQEWSWRPRIAVPARARVVFLAVTPINVALWALSGFYLALMPSLIATMAGPAVVWVGGVAVAALMLGASAIILIAQKQSASSALLLGAGALIVGQFGILAGANFASATLLLTSSVFAGIGFGAAFLGALRSITLLAEPQERGALMAAYYIESYLAYALPAIAAGYFAQRIGLLATANVFGALVILLAIMAMVLAFIRRHETAPRITSV